MTEVSGNLSADSMREAMLDLAKMKDEPLHPDLQPYREKGPWGPILRHPLVYQVPAMVNGFANRMYEHKREALAKAVEEKDWHSVVFLHERAYRLRALIDYVTGRDEYDRPLPLSAVPEKHWDLAADVWVDSENIQQVIEDWRALFNNGETGIWLGTDEERAEFDALPRLMVNGEECIHAWRGGAVGDWSWTTDQKVAAFFSRRSGLPVRGYKIPVSDVFGYLTRRGEAELLVRFTEFRRHLVYPVSGNEVT